MSGNNFAEKLVVQNISTYPPRGLAILGAKYVAPVGSLMIMAAKSILTEYSCAKNLKMAFDIL